MTCEGFESRLIAGEKPGDDLTLAAHVGTCLRCFRTAADMREVPHLQALLRDGERAGAQGAHDEGSFDPGPGFWDKFPGQVSAGWVSARAGQGRDPAASLSRWERASRWLRRPVPAALTGAVCAAGVALLVMVPTWRAPSEGPRASDLEGSAPSDITGEIGTTGASGAYDAVGELDVEELATLRDGLSRALGQSEGATGAAADPEVASATASVDPTTVVEDLEMLDETGLLALRDRLGRI